MDTKQFTVLLVEDDLNDIFLVKRAFRIARLETPLQVVTDGQEAMDYLNGHGRYADRQAHPLPQLVVMDIHMPRLSGFQVLEWIKRSGPFRRIPVVIVSSSERPDDDSPHVEYAGPNRPDASRHAAQENYQGSLASRVPIGFDFFVRATVKCRGPDESLNEGCDDAPPFTLSGSSGRASTHSSNNDPYKRPRQVDRGLEPLRPIRRQ